MPTYLPERFETTTVRMRHYGYLRSRITAKDKSRRNIELLEIEARENPSPFNDYNLGSEYLSLGDAAKARAHFDRSYEQLARAAGLVDGRLRAAAGGPRSGQPPRRRRPDRRPREAIAEGLAVYPRPHRPGDGGGALREAPRAT